MPMKAIGTTITAITKPMKIPCEKKVYWWKTPACFLVGSSGSCRALRRCLVEKFLVWLDEYKTKKSSWNLLRIALMRFPRMWSTTNDRERQSLSSLRTFQNANTGE